MRGGEWDRARRVGNGADAALPSADSALDVLRWPAGDPMVFTEVRNEFTCHMTSDTISNGMDHVVFPCDHRTLDLTRPVIDEVLLCRCYQPMRVIRRGVDAASTNRNRSQEGSCPLRSPTKKRYRVNEVRRAMPDERRDAVRDAGRERRVRQAHPGRLVQRAAVLPDLLLGPGERHIDSRP